jgi:Protein of unknown function (DUF3237)
VANEGGGQSKNELKGPGQETANIDPTDPNLPVELNKEASMNRTPAWLQAIAMVLTILALPTLADDGDGRPSTQIATEYLMTLYAPLDPPQIVDDTLYIYNVAPGGWVKGPKISGKVVPPSGDWFRVMPSGVSRLDVRLSIIGDDNQPILMTYNGIVRATKESVDRLLKGEVMVSL